MLRCFVEKYYQPSKKDHSNSLYADCVSIDSFTFHWDIELWASVFLLFNFSYISVQFWESFALVNSICIMNRENQYSMPLLPTYIREIYSQLPFDMNLVSSDKKKVPVHYIVMAIYSKFLRKMFGTEKFKLGLEGELMKILTDSINRFHKIKSNLFFQSS